MWQISSNIPIDNLQITMHEYKHNNMNNVGTL